MFIPPKYWDLDAKNSPIFGINMTICFKRHCNNYGLIYQSLEHLCHSYWKNWGTCTYHRDFGSFLLSMSINNNEVSFLQVVAGNRCCKSYLEHSCSTKYFSNMQAQNYFYGIMSQFDHQFCDEESRLGKSKTFFFVKAPLLCWYFWKFLNMSHVS